MPTANQPATDPSWSWPSDTKALIDAVRSMDGFEVRKFPASWSGEDENGPTVAMALVPDGKKLVNVQTILDAYLQNPRFLKGNVRTFTLASFIDYTERSRGGDTLIFAKPFIELNSQPHLMAIYDYHGEGSPDVATANHGHHLATYAFPLSEQWKAWIEINGDEMSQREFAEMIEDRLIDVADPPSANDAEFKRLLEAFPPGARFADRAAMVELSRGLRVNQDRRLSQSVNLDSGETEFAFEATNVEPGGARVRKPNAFLLNIPVFDGGPKYRLAARLRYNVDGTAVSWRILLHRPEVIGRHAFDEDVKLVREAGNRVVIGWLGG